MLASNMLFNWAARSSGGPSSVNAISGLATSFPGEAGELGLVLGHERPALGQRLGGVAEFGAFGRDRRHGQAVDHGREGVREHLHRDGRRDGRVREQVRAAEEDHLGPEQHRRETGDDQRPQHVRADRLALLDRVRDGDQDPEEHDVDPEQRQGDRAGQQLQEEGTGRQPEHHSNE
jgi:hypothetical protein